MGVRLRTNMTDGVPGKFQLIWEILVVDIVGDLVKSSLGEKGKRFIPLGVTVFVFVLVVQLDRLSPHGDAARRIGRDLPGPHERREPSARTRALRHRVGAHRVACAHGASGATSSTTRKPAGWLTPINLIEEVTKPITLTLRLFGNLFSGGSDHRCRGGAGVQGARPLRSNLEALRSRDRIDSGVHLHVAHDHLSRHGDEPRGRARREARKEEEEAARTPQYSRRRSNTNQEE